MPGLTIHVIDISRGVPAAGMRVELWSLGEGRRALADAQVDAKGALDMPELARRILAVGVYEAVFHVGPYYRAQGIVLPNPAFLELVPFRFGIADAAQHYHLPLKVSPWGISLFRGGA